MALNRFAKRSLVLTTAASLAAGTFLTTAPQLAFADGSELATAVTEPGAVGSGLLPFNQSERDSLVTAVESAAEARDAAQAKLDAALNQALSELDSAQQTLDTVKQTVKNKAELVSIRQQALTEAKATGNNEKIAQAAKGLADAIASRDKAEETAKAA